MGQGLCRGCYRMKQHYQKKALKNIQDQDPDTIVFNHKPEALKKIKEFFEAERYVLHSNLYHDRDTRLTCTCPRGHLWETNWMLFQRGTRCKRCSDDRKKIHSISEIASEFALEGYTLLTTSYIRNDSLLDYICPQGHTRQISWKNWQQGDRCMFCKPNPPLTIERVKQAFEAEKYILLSTEYRGLFAKLACQCPVGHKYEVTWKLWKVSKARCPHCAHPTSKGQQEILDLYAPYSAYEAKDILIDPNNKRSKQDIDILIPAVSSIITRKERQAIGIEYCGLHYHSDYYDRITPTYHRNKMLRANDLGIRLITVFEDEWKFKKEICTSRINNALGLIKNKIAARKCSIKEITSDEAEPFLERNHIQGFPKNNKVSLSYGLYYQNKLVQVLSLGSLNRMNTAQGLKVLELKRLAGSLDTVIVGGAAKLFKLALQYAKKNDYDQIRSYCDLRWGTGNLYQQLGMTLSKASKFSIFYTDGSTRWTNLAFASTEKETERQIIERKGLYRIHDCGHQTWILNLKDSLEKQDPILVEQETENDQEHPLEIEDNSNLLDSKNVNPVE